MNLVGLYIKGGLFCIDRVETKWIFLLQQPKSTHSNSVALLVWSSSSQWVEIIFSWEISSICVHVAFHGKLLSIGIFFKGSPLTSVDLGSWMDCLSYTVVRKFAILVSFGILVVFMALELQANARVWYFLWENIN
jgi:hypothetical protein